MFEFDADDFRDAVVELIRRTSTRLPEDVLAAMEAHRDREAEGSAARSVLSFMIRNAREAEKNSTPICQDTGTNLHFVTIPEGVSLRKVETAIRDATRIATEKVYLRPNAVDSITGKNSGDNTGEMAPFIHFDEWDEPAIRLRLALKGGGCENVSTQYKLPSAELKAGRDLDGVYKCIVDAVNRAQGLGCAPGVLGVGVGGDRATGMIVAKKQLFRLLTDTNPNPDLADLETKLYQDLNTLGIGPMGFGGKTTVLAVKIGAAHRLPASFFVSIAYMCWADRRRTMLYTPGEVTYD
ncbi:MAG: fumarate hydratase [Candidatus Neomarinimicrobiota bacterium]|nr:MAG: fumarate hydratase [Candidatus Neomarinimicrobiota bacterium]